MQWASDSCPSSAGHHNAKNPKPATSYATMFKATLQQAAAGAALLIGTTAAAPALADINASATTSGTASSYTLVARITPDA